MRSAEWIRPKDGLPSAQRPVLIAYARQHRPGKPFRRRVFLALLGGNGIWYDVASRMQFAQNRVLYWRDLPAFPAKEAA